jgi:hypothetical protein
MCVRSFSRMYDFHFLKNKVGEILEFRVWTRFGNQIFINVHFEKMSGRIFSRSLSTCRASVE